MRSSDNHRDGVVGRSHPVDGSAATLLLAIFFALGFTPRLLTQVSAYPLWEVQQSRVVDFGRSIAVIGDINHDGFDDLVVGSGGSLSPSHAVLTLSGIDGSILHTTPAPPNVNNFGGGVSGAGDTNGDQFPDYLVSAASWSGLYSGQNHTLLFSHSFPQGHATGSHVGIGDINSDGRPDFILLVCRTPNNTNGYANVYSGVDGTLLYQLQEWPSFGAWYGFAAADLGDVDGDGRPDIAVSAPYHCLPSNCPGMVYVCSGYNGALLYTVSSNSPGNPVFGVDVAGIGDIDLDGRGDFVVGGMEAGAARDGAIWVFSGQNGALLYTHTGGPSEAFGEHVGGGHDIDDDGVPDYFGSGPAGPNGNGVVRVYSGATGQMIFSVTGTSANGDFGRTPHFGRFDADDRMDLVVGAPEARTVHTFTTAAPPTLTLNAPPQIGTTVDLLIDSPADAGYVYAAGFSLGDQPGMTLPDSRRVPLNPGWFLNSSLTPNNGVFVDTLGLLDAAGQATVLIVTPNLPLLSGLTVHSAFAVFDPAAPLGVRRISSALPIQVQ